MITVGVCGFGFTGSGAVLDLLEDYKDVTTREGELGVAYGPDGLLDLKRAICTPCRFMSSNAAIPRFINFTKRQRMCYRPQKRKQYQAVVESFLEKLKILQWKGYDSNFWHLTNGLDFWLIINLGIRFRLKYDRIFGPLNSHGIPERSMYYSFMDENEFDKAAQHFLKDMCYLHNGDITSRILALDQPFPANNPRSVFGFYENPRAIIVKRDPRDLYLIAKRDLSVAARFIPSDNVDDFIRFFKGQMESCVYKDGEDVMTINFEDLIYDNTLTENKIARFIGVKKKTDIQKPHFEPSRSINNTQMWLKYPQYIEDVKMISEKLKDYLYDFSRFEIKPTFDSKSF